MHILASLLTFTATTLIVLLAFETTTCYKRFDKTRKTWSADLNRCQEMDSKKDEKTLQYFIQSMKVFPYHIEKNIEAQGHLQNEFVNSLYV